MLEIYFFLWKSINAFIAKLWSSCPRKYINRSIKFGFLTVGLFSTKGQRIPRIKISVTFYIFTVLRSAVLWLWPLCHSRWDQVRSSMSMYINYININQFSLHLGILCVEMGGRCDSKTITGPKKSGVTEPTGAKSNSSWLVSKGGRTQ